MNELQLADCIRVSLGDDGVAVATLDQPGKVNKLGALLLAGLEALLAWTTTGPSAAGRPLTGLVFTSAHRDFCVGADLDMIYGERDPATVLALTTRLNGLLRQFEAGPVPVACVLAGSALGGGFEIALACHYRVAVDDPRVQIGLPEVNLGVIPGGGGTQRLPRLIGLQAALEHILGAKLSRPVVAHKAGLVHALAPDAAAALADAKAFCLANPKARQPWDARQRMPGPQPGTADARNLLLAAQAMLFKKTAGAYPAAEAALAVVQEGAGLQLDRALEVEGRAFAKLVVSDQAKAMIRTLFMHRTAAEKHVGLPATGELAVQKVAVIGAGMMGAGLAFICLKAGFHVVLKDVRDEALAKGAAHVQAQIDGLKHATADERAALQARFTPSLALEDVAGTDLVIEAVFEDLKLKHRIIAEIEPLLSPDAIFASNTSALPIGDLAQVSVARDRFVGLHFFSPVEQMPLLEIIRGPQTSEATIARALAFCRAIKKLPIVVNDGYGFYTTRVFSSYILEGAQLVAEGYDPRVVEWAARQAGMVVPPLQVFDEVTLTLGKHAMAEARAYGHIMDELPGMALVERLVDAGRLGKAHGAGFYEYVNGKRRGIWSGLASLVGAPDAARDITKPDAAQLGRRLLLAQVAEVGRALDDGVIRAHRDADLGAVMGIGFAPNTGGPLALCDTVGLPALVAELDALALDAGRRFRASDTLRAMAANDQRFY